MKKSMYILLIISLFTFILTGCGNSKVDDKLAEDYVERSEHVIHLLNNKQFDEISELFDRNLRLKVKENEFERLYGHISDSGDFIAIEHSSVEREKDYYVTILATKYEKDHYIFTIKYDRNDDVSDFLIQ